METVTFYSYKGGVGRTLLLAQCALHLARLGARVVALDFDLDAPGLHYRLLGKGPFPPPRGLVDLIDDYVSRGKLYESLEDASYVVESDDLRAPGLLRVIPAGPAPSRPYWQRLANINWRSLLYGEAMGPEFLEDLRRHIEAEFKPDVLLVDSRTGITEIGHATLALLADRVVCVVSDRSENLDGAREVLRGLCRTRRASEGRAPDVLIAVSRPHPSVAWERRESNVRAFLEEPGETLDDVLRISALIDLPHEPELDRQDRNILGTSAGRYSLLVERTMLLAERLVSETVSRRLRDAEAQRLLDSTPLRGCIWSYRQFAIAYGELEITGFVRVGRHCYIVCPELATLPSEDRERANTWFAHHRQLATPIDLVATAPPEAVPIAEPSLEDLVELRDHPHTARDLEFELSLRLPKDFPDFSCTEDPPRFVVTVTRPLSAGETTRLEQVFASFRYGDVLRLEVVVSASAEKPESVQREVGDGDVKLVQSRWLSRAYSSAVRRLVEEDEDLWMARRMAVHRGEIGDPRHLLPVTLKHRASRILVDTTVAPWCIPAALPIADQLLLVLPFGESQETHVARMGLDISSMCAMAESGRLIAILPKSVDRYAPALVNALVERAPAAIVGSRTLGGATIVALQRRLGPWLYPPFGVRERRERLHRLVEEPRNLRVAMPLLEMLRSHWSHCEILAHRLGGLSPMYGGLVQLVADQLKQATGRDFTIQASHASTTVVWAAALRAIVAPHHHASYSEIGLSLVAARTLTVFGDQNLPWHNAPEIGYSLLSTTDGSLAQEIRGRPEAIQVRQELAAALEGGPFDAGPLGLALASWTEAVRVATLGKEAERLAIGTPIQGGPPDVEAAQLRGIRDYLAGGSADVADQGTSDGGPPAPLLLLAPDLAFLSSGRAKGPTPAAEDKA